MTEKTHRVAPVKKEIVKKIGQYVQDYPIIGVVNMENLPTAQLQRMRHQLRGKVELFMTKISLIKLALAAAQSSKKGIEVLDPYVKGMPALLFTKDNPFLLYKTLKKSKSPAPAKPGQTAPKDLVVLAGPTPFSPGPVISEFAALGIKAGVEGGKVAVKQDTVVCKEGQQISAPLASMLARLGIEPMEVGLDLVAVYENGTLYTKNVLDIDENVFLNSIMHAAAEAFNLAIDIALPIKDTIDVLLQKGFREAKAVALEGNIMADAVVAELVEKAEREMLALTTAANITTVETPHEASPAPAKDPEKQEKKEPPAQPPAPKKEERPAKKEEPVKKTEHAQPKETPPAPVHHQKQEHKAPSHQPSPDHVQNSVNKIVGDLQRHETPKPSAEKIVDDVHKETPDEQRKVQSDKKEIDEVAALTQKLLKKGTLR